MEELLEKIKELKIMYSKADKFNPYLILDLKKEVIHSKFIKALLDPNEIHGFKNEFLDLFLERIAIKGFDTSNVTAECEKITSNNRRIDITIENKKAKQLIIIENKIEANDQDNQLSDYYDFGLELCENKSENVYLIYLTPYGRLPSDNSFPEEKRKQKKIQCISYEKVILEWLEDCLKRTVDKDNRLHLSIEMYIELIRKTINRDKYMEEILNQLLEKPAQMKFAIDVVNSLQGRNFLKYGSVSRVKIIERLKEASENCFVGDINSYDEGDVHYIDETEHRCIAIEDIRIYGRDKKDGKDIDTLGTWEILGNNLSNKYLVALLTNNQELIKKWITETLNDLDHKVQNS